jgi:hypothetical protein
MRMRFEIGKRRGVRVEIGWRVIGKFVRVPGETLSGSWDEARLACVRVDFFEGGRLRQGE